MKRAPIRVAIAGVGNCASALLQGIDHYRSLPTQAHPGWGLMHLEMGGYRPSDVEVVAAFDIDRRKVVLREPLKKLGEFDVPIKLHREVTTHVKVRVTAEGQAEKAKGQN